MKRSILALLFLAAFLSGCAVAPKHIALHTGQDAVDITHLHNSQTYTTYDRVELTAVDGRPIGDAYVGATVTVAPGQRRLTTRMYFKRGMGPEFHGFTTLVVDLQPGSKLRLNGKVDGPEVVVWLEDLNGKRISQESKGTWVVAPRHHTTVPVFIPVR